MGLFKRQLNNDASASPAHRFTQALFFESVSQNALIIDIVRGTPVVSIKLTLADGAIMDVDGFPDEMFDDFIGEYLSLAGISRPKDGCIHGGTILFDDTHGKIHTFLLTSTDISKQVRLTRIVFG